MPTRTFTVVQCAFLLTNPSKDRNLPSRKYRVSKLLPVVSLSEMGFLLCCQTETVRVLGSLGAAVNAQNLERLTALHVASANGETETVIQLVAMGAHVHARNMDGLLPLHGAASGASFWSLLDMVQIWTAWLSSCA